MICFWLSRPNQIIYIHIHVQILHLLHCFMVHSFSFFFLNTHRFGTKGLAISFIASQEDRDMLKEVQSRFQVKIDPLPEEVDPSAYMNA